MRRGKGDRGRPQRGARGARDSAGKEVRGKTRLANINAGVTAAIHREAHLLGLEPEVERRIVRLIEKTAAKFKAERHNPKTDKFAKDLARRVHELRVALMHIMPTNTSYAADRLAKIVEHIVIDIGKHFGLKDKIALKKFREGSQDPDTVNVLKLARLPAIHTLHPREYFDEERIAEIIGVITQAEKLRTHSKQEIGYTHELFELIHKAAKRIFHADEVDLANKIAANKLDFVQAVFSHHTLTGVGRDTTAGTFRKVLDGLESRVDHVIDVLRERHVITEEIHEYISKRGQIADADVRTITLEDINQSPIIGFLSVLKKRIPVFRAEVTRIEKNK